MRDLILEHKNTVAYREDQKSATVLFPYGSTPEAARVTFANFTSKDEALKRLYSTVKELK